MSEEVYLTQEGFDRLSAELVHLKGDGRRDIADRIREAREFGDLSENAEYDQAKNDQAVLETRINELEIKLRDVVIITEKSSDVVGLGSKVSILDQTTRKKAVYTIVGSTEANPSQGMLSNESPVGKALLGAKKGQVVTVESPQGARKLRISKIEA